MRIIRFSELAEQPWKNGGGITRHIAEHRLNETLHWRLSMADVAVDGPFSDFSGLTRILTVIQGIGMTLSSPDAVLQADFASPVTFDGATPISSQLVDGPLRDLNLMFDPNCCDGQISTLHGPLQEIYPARSGQTLGLHCITGTVGISGAEPLHAGDTALATGTDVDLDMAPGAIALLILLQTTP